MSGSGIIGPGNLRLKKELSQIRKASRVLRDPGTTSTWRSPLSSGRSLAVIGNAALPSIRNNHCFDHNKSSSYGNNICLDSNYGFKVNLQVENDGSCSGKGKDKRVFLCNWKSQKSESEKSVQTMGQMVKYEKNGEGGGDDLDSMLGESVDGSVSEGRNGGEDSKSHTYLADRYGELILRSKDANLRNPIRRNTMKKKVKRSAQSDVFWKKHLQQQIVLSKSAKGKKNLSLKGEDSESFVYKSDDTGYFNSEDLRYYSTESPLLARLRSSKLSRSSRKDVSCYSYSTPAMSVSSFNKYSVQYPSTAGSWDPANESCNGEDDHLDPPGSRGCGLPCYWSKRSSPKHRGARESCYSPSLSDILRMKGSSLLCGSRGASLSSNKKRFRSRASQGLIPLLTSSGNGRVGSSLGTWRSDDDSTNYGGLDLESTSRLDGRRRSTSCKSQEGLELVALYEERESGSIHETVRSLSQKYRPIFFEDLVGQHVVVQSLMNAVLRVRIAPLYLFQGPLGTGKTSAARIFAMALNCLANEENKPCGVCRECTDFILEKSKDIVEVDGSNGKGIDKVRYMLKKLSVGPLETFSRYKVFIIDECHLLPEKAWLAFLKCIEEPPPLVLFIFITTDLENVPRTVLLRCQKFVFNKIEDCVIVSKLRKMADGENLDVESDALDLIALNADGSLRDAETMLDQLTLLGKRITTSLVNQLVGVVSDEKLLELLELAMSSETAETVKRARELLDSGIDPMLMMSQLASLIMDIISGTYHIVDSRHDDSFFGGRSLNEGELDRLKHALKLLSEADKHLRFSSERSTWFTATLLQLGSVPSPDPTLSGSSRHQSSKTIEEDPSSTLREVIVQNIRRDSYASRESTSPRCLSKAFQQISTSQEQQLISLDSKPIHSLYINGDASNVSPDASTVDTTNSSSANSDILNDIWMQCTEKCNPDTLRQLLQSYGKLVSISEVEGDLVAYIAFGNRAIKMRAERFLSCITNSFKIVLQHNIGVKIILLPDDGMSINSERHVPPQSPLVQKQMYSTEVINGEKRVICTNELYGYSDLDSYQEPAKMSRGSRNDSQGKLVGTYEPSAKSPARLVEGNAKIKCKKERKPVAPVRRIESIIHEQRLETAWLQIAEKSTPGSLSRSKPERNQILPQDGIHHRNQMKSMDSKSLTSLHWEDELNAELNALKINGGEVLHKDQVSRRVDHSPMSPSILHKSVYAGKFSRESTGYESSSGAGGCTGFLCWINSKNHRTGKIKQSTPVRPHKSSRFLWLGECAKLRRSGDRFTR